MPFRIRDATITFVSITMFKGCRRPMARHRGESWDYVQSKPS